MSHRRSAKRKRLQKQRINRGLRRAGKIFGEDAPSFLPGARCACCCDGKLPKRPPRKLQTNEEDVTDGG